MKTIFLLCALLLLGFAFGCLYDGTSNVHGNNIFAVFFAICAGYVFRMVVEDDI